MHAQGTVIHGNKMQFSVSSAHKVPKDVCLRSCPVSLHALSLDDKMKTSFKSQLRTPPETKEFKTPEEKVTKTLMLF